jgi:hypothetical protein
MTSPPVLRKAVGANAHGRSEHDLAHLGALGTIVGHGMATDA